jgi:hypothetical protein
MFWSLWRVRVAHVRFAIRDCAVWYKNEEAGRIEKPRSSMAGAGEDCGFSMNINRLHHFFLVLTCTFSLDAFTSACLPVATSCKFERGIVTRIGWW